MTLILVLFALLLGILSMLLWLTQATVGVGVIAFAILLAIVARINQAENHQRKIVAVLEQEFDRRARKEHEKS